MYTHMLLFTLVGAPDTCPEVLVPVCTELAAGRSLEAAELAAPLAADASVAPNNRRFAASLAAAAWIQEGSPDARCRAQALLDAYFAEPDLPRTAALERHHREVEADKCEKSGSPEPNTPAASPPPAPAPEPKAPAATDRLRSQPGSDRPDKERRTTGRALFGTGLGLGLVSLGTIAVSAYYLLEAQAITTRAIVEHRLMTFDEKHEFQRVFGIADQTRWIALGFGVAGVVTLATSIPLLVSAKRRARVSPYVRGGSAGVIFSGAF